MQPLDPFVVDQVVSGSPASKAGLLPNDRIMTVGKESIRFFPELQKVLKTHAGKPVAVQVERASQPVELNVNVDDDGKIGFLPKSLLKFETREYGLVEAVPMGTKQAFGVVTTQMKAFAKIFRGEASFRKSVGGPIEIAQQYGGKWDWLRFWTLTGLLSMVLAFMNLLPIPALDGGHVVFLLYEMISGRKPSDAFMENAQKVGMMIILGLMAFTLIINPLIKAFGQ